MGPAKVCGVVAIATLLLQVYSVDAGCGYENCPVAKPGHLNVHLVAHTHDDVGWLKTVDQYYYGGKDYIQLAGVQYILDSVISELQKAPDRRFIYVESGFFWRWWKNQDDDMKNVVRKLVDNGQLEFIGGGWCMNDEAAASYNEIIDQMTLGLRFLNDTFGTCGLPKVAWQIDPFGHSREQASIFAQMGFDGLFFGRLDYQDKENRELHKNMETIWSASPENYGRSSWLFTGALRNGYNPPDGFCFDVLCRDEPIQDDPDLLDYNLKKRVDDFISAAKKWALPYRTKNILMTMGSDFHYLAAHLWFKNMDKLIKHVNQRQVNGTKINLFYSTPSCYLQELNRENITWSVKTDDFFPYASDPYSFWTGYFTSRPALKYFVHKSNNLYQACQQLAATNDVSGELLGDVFKMAEPMGVLQHHDAVSGTAKQHVTDDYSRRLQIGVDACQRVISKAITRTYNHQNAQQKSSAEESVHFDIDSMPTLKEDAISFCPLVNISACRATETESNLVISAYNPLARILNNYYIRIPVASTGWTVKGPQGEIPTQLLPIPPSVNGVPGRKSSGKYELTFNTGSLPALTVTHFQLTTTDQESTKKIKPFRKSWKASSYTVPVIRHQTGRGGRRDPGHEPTVVEESYEASNFVLENSLGLKCEFDGATGHITSIRMGHDKVALSQNFYYYEGHIGNNTRFEYRASGAYIFRPNGTHAHVINPKPEYRIYKGKDVSEVRQTFSDWVSQVIRIYDKQPYVEFEWLIGSIPIEDGKGKEIITRYTSDLETRGFFYTDSNGREILERKRDFRPTWPYQVYEPIAGNYYPVNSRIYMEDRNASGQQPKRRLLVLNDRSQGGSSIKDGQVELMLHRRLLLDDAFGVDEALNEEQFGRGLVTRGTHRLLFTGGRTGLNSAIHRSLGQEMSIAPILSYYRPPDDFDTSTVPTGLSKLSSILPENCHLLTLSKLEANKFILRLEHLYEKNEDPQGFSKPIQLSIPKLQEAIGFDWIRETTLGANQWKDEARRMDWKPENARENVAAKHSKPLNWSAKEGPILDDTITLQPMEIRTFLLTVPQLNSKIQEPTDTKLGTNHIRKATQEETSDSDEM